MAHKIEPELCMACKACVYDCQQGAIRLNDDTGRYAIDPYLCVDCGECVDKCPNGAIQ